MQHSLQPENKFSIISDRQNSTPGLRLLNEWVWAHLKKSTDGIFQKGLDGESDFTTINMKTFGEKIGWQSDATTTDGQT